MKSFSEQIEWFNSVESRRWKRIYHCVELSLIALAGLIIVGVTSIYGDGTKLQALLLAFIGAVSFASFLLTPALYNPTFKRWHIFAITLGLGCAMGVSTVASLLLLDLQLTNV